MIKVLAFNGSPKMGKGNTALILAPFLKGMRDAGAAVELFYTKKLRINPCQGEFYCSLRFPGMHACCNPSYVRRTSGCLQRQFM